MSLNEAQKRAVSHKEGPCLVLAGPGSGKTLTIAKRIEYLICGYKVRPEEILVITFTKYAAKEMKERFRKVMGTAGFPVTFGTFHGIYYGILKWAYGLNQSNLFLEEEKYRLLGEITAQLEWEGDWEEAEEKEILLELSEEIGRVKNHGLDIETYESERHGILRFREIYRRYEEEKRKRKKVDFEDMLVLCRDLFLKRPDVLRKWQERFRYILVDEFQDINQIQYDVIRLLASPEDNLFVVGDDDQSVYGFRGAKPGIMQAFIKDYPEAEKVLLDINYRSGSYIVSGASRVIAHNRQRYEKKICACRKEAETVHIQETENPLEESRYIVSKSQEYMKQGVPPEQIAVLYRTASDARVLAETFTECQIPFSMKEHVEHMYEHFTCMDMECYFRLALGRYTRADMVRVMNRPKRYLARDSVADGKITYEDLRLFYCDKSWMQEWIDKFEQDVRTIGKAAPYAAIQYIRKSVGYEEFLKEYAVYRGLKYEEIQEVLDELQERAKEYRTLEEWLSYVKEARILIKAGAGKEKPEHAVEFLTMHGAKGLEYEVVFMIQGNEGVTPHKRAQTEEEIEEERRLFYVAMTRAKRKLFISYVKEKNGKSKSPSRFVQELFVV